MKKSRFTDSQVLAVLKQAEASWSLALRQRSAGKKTREHPYGLMHARL